MLGYQLVIFWFSLFFSIFLPLSYYLELNRPLTIIMLWVVWSFFVSLFEFILPFNMKYVCEKGKEYYNNNTCLWSEKGYSLTSIFDKTLYMNAYADYSLADSKYRKGYTKSNETSSHSFRCVMLGEMIHGVFSFIFSVLVLYNIFIGGSNAHKNLHILLLGATQFALICWYQSTVFWDMLDKDSENYYLNEKWWWPPLLWNLPWFIFPPYLIYYSYVNLTA
jgi:hypothetical protein